MDNARLMLLEGIFTDALRLVERNNTLRPGLFDTPERMAKAWGHWFDGYYHDPKSIMTVFEDGAEQADEMVLVKNIRFYSHCEHHLAPFFGYVHIGYIPSGKIVGLSKLARLTDIYARRLQVQERLTNQIASALFDGLQPEGVAVAIEARHLCMESRGVQQCSTTMTTKLLGCLRDDASAKAEFLKAIETRITP